MADHPDGPPRPKPLSFPARLCLLVLALLSTALGIIGIFVPGLPTTVFILIAAWAAARSSPRLHTWLESHRWFGPLLRNWRETGSVSRRSKWTATVLMAACAIILFLTSRQAWVAPAATAVMATVLLWLWRRPLPAGEMVDR